MLGSMTGAGGAARPAGSAPRAPIRRRVLRWVGAVVGLGVVGFAVWSVRVMLPRATGFAAKVGCTAVFVSGRELERVRNEELGAVGFVDLEVDEARGEIEASVVGLARQRARHHAGRGCSLVRDEGPGLARAADSQISTTTSESEPDPRAWPLGDGEDPRPDPAGLDRRALDAAVDRAFDELDPEQPLRTRAVLVAWQGRLLVERYGEGIDARTPLPGWSMAKTITSALVGLLVARGELDVEAPAPVPEWHEDPDDPRAAITLDHLLRMSSGLEFEERYGPFGEGSDMLFVDGSASERAIAKPLIAEPGTRCVYSSGTANIVARIVRDQFADPGEQLSFARRELFEPLGVRTAVLELDPSGTFIGSSFALMSARDWARLGQLYLDDGVWAGRRIFSAGWVAYTRTPGPACEGSYGAMVQTNVGARRLPSLPEDTFEMVGHEGQSVLIVPSRDAVIVRLGLTQAPARWDTDGFAAAILAALPEQ